MLTACVFFVCIIAAFIAGCLFEACRTGGSLDLRVARELDKSVARHPSNVTEIRRSNRGNAS